MNSSHIWEKHRQEWLASGVDEDIIQLNVKSLSDQPLLEHLLYAWKPSKKHPDAIHREINRRFGRLTQGGFWINGLDPFDNWNPMEWGRFKPDRPRLNWDKEKQCHTDKIVKYESPPDTPNRVTYFRVSRHKWQLVAERYGVPMPENIVETSEAEALGFWDWVVEHPEIPLILTEGEKKAGRLLSLGFVAIGLPGIWNGRVGNRIIERLHPDLMPVAQKGREFIILFDYETKPQVRKSIFNATRRTGQCIINVGCQCKVALLPGPEKGIDDWSVAQGKKANKAVTALITDAFSLSDYHQSFFLNRHRGLRKYKPNIKVNSRYLSSAVGQLPESGLVGLLSDMKTGKTKLLEDFRDAHPQERFLNNGHRVNLLKNLAERLKTKMYSAVGCDLGLVKALSITVDSLYKLATNLQTYGCLFIDEACQYLAHLLKSKTCKQFRSEILNVLERLVYSSKLVVLADAHLDDVTIDFFLAMRPAGEKPFIIQNEWRSGGRKVFWYEGSNSSALVAAIHTAIMTGQKVIVVSDSKRFIKKLERTLHNLTTVEENDSPELETNRRLRVWAIHSDNSGSEENVTFITDITKAVKSIDALLTSPTLGTGVDICGGEGEYHFDLIFGAFHAVSQAATECAQQLWRYRPDVPMHVWVAPRPPFGYLETNPRRIKEWILQKNEMTAFLIRIDRETGKRGAEKDWALEASCQIEAQRNWSINNLRQDLRSLLEEMGNTIIPMADAADEITSARMRAAAEAIDQEHCLAVANAANITRKIYESRQHQEYLNPEEHLECEKFRIGDTYGMEVTPKLVENDDGGRLIRKIAALEAILAEPGETIVDEQGREFITPPEVVVERDRHDRDTYQISTDWSNHSVAWLVRYKLGFRDIVIAMMNGEELTNSDPRTQTLAEQSHRNAPHVKTFLNLTIPADKSPMWIVSQYLGQIGLSTQSRRQGARGQQVRRYGLNPDDLAFALQVIEHRQRKRQERERMRQEERERNAYHAARVQSLYSSQPSARPVVNPPPKVGGETFEGGLTTESGLPNSGWQERVKAYGQLLVEAFECGVEAIQELLKPWTEEERWGAMHQFEAIAPEKMAQLVEIAPSWVGWCCV